MALLFFDFPPIFPGTSSIHGAPSVKSLRNGFASSSPPLVYLTSTFSSCILTEYVARITQRHYSRGALHPFQEKTFIVQPEPPLLPTTLADWYDTLKK